MQDPQKKDLVDEVLESAKRWTLWFWLAKKIDFRGCRNAESGHSSTEGGTRKLVGFPNHVNNPPCLTVSNNLILCKVFWKQGFTVDDGDLRRYDDPANSAFLVGIYLLFERVT